MAGLLDALFSPSEGGGLLEFLRRNAAMQPMPSGLPSDVAQYGASSAAAPPAITSASAPLPSPLDNAPWPAGPIGAPSQANASMVAPQSAPAVSAPQSAPMAAPPAAGPSGFMTGYENLRNGGGLIGSIAAGLTGQRNDPISVAQQRESQVKNLTARALIAKGVAPEAALTAVQPGNGDILKTLFAQAYGPETIQSLGSGYVYHPRTGKIERAFEPDDKTPQSALEYEYYKRSLPAGETPVTYQKWIATKDTDPSKVNVLGKGGELYTVGADGKPVIVHKNEEGSDAATIDDKTTDLLASRVLAGDTKALTGLGRGAQGAANILKIQQRAAEIAESKGMDASGILANVARQAELVSGARALGTKATHFGVAEKAMEESLPLALAASQAVPRSDWMAINKLVQAGQTQHSNPQLKRFLIATDTAAKDYARTINPQGALRESDIEYARKILSTADGPEAYEAALDQLKMEAQVMHRAIERQRNDTYKGGGGHSTSTTSAPAAPAPGAYVWSPGKGLSATP